MTSTAVDHMEEAADTLRQAARIADPYQRADVIWEAVLHLRSASACFGDRVAQHCDEIARNLEEGCEANGTLPDAEALKHYARCLADH